MFAEGKAVVGIQVDTLADGIPVFDYYIISKEIQEKGSSLNNLQAWPFLMQMVSGMVKNFGKRELFLKSQGN